MAVALTTSEFITKARIIHGNRYIYSKSEYTLSQVKVIIKCRKHGEFRQAPNTHLTGGGCLQCARNESADKNRTGTVEFIKKAKAKHRSVYTYEKTKYERAHSPVMIRCRIHGFFNMTANCHLSGQGCPKCGKETMRLKNKKSQTEYLAAIAKTHGATYIYDKTEYRNAFSKVIVTCRKHGDFEIVARSHARGMGCPECKPKRYSMIACIWIEEEAARRGLTGVIHAANGKEYRIPGTPYFADGYHAPTRTVFEFYGDHWHGNPSIFDPQEQCHPMTGEIASVLLQKTILKERVLSKLGYALVSIWEADFRRQKGWAKEFTGSLSPNTSSV